MSEQRNQQKQQGGGQQKPSQHQQQPKQKFGDAGKKQDEVDKENRKKAVSPGNGASFCSFGGHRPRRREAARH